jgi:hypothetical protein
MANPIISHDNKHFAVEIETEDSLPLDIEIPLSEIGTIVEFLVSISSHQQPDYKPLNLPEQLNISPIKINGLGFAMGNSTEETLLIVRLSGFDLAFSLDSNKLEELGLDFARTAQALAANNQNPQ